MLWEVEIRPLGRDAERERVCDEFDLLTHARRGGDLVSASARGYLLEGELHAHDVARLCNELLVDPLVESVVVAPLGLTVRDPAITVLLKPGVMDPVTESVLKSSRDLGVRADQVRTFRRYFTREAIPSADRDTLVRRVLANDAIEQVVFGPVKADHLTLGRPYRFELQSVPLRELGDDALLDVSRSGQLALSLDEMKTIRSHFRDLGRDPTDCELETIAQTWSEHCSHKTLKGRIDYAETIDGRTRTTRYANMLKETIFAATQAIRAKLGADDWCVSVFADNAGVVTFDERFHACIKVETHNRPSAIEPYGGANTGLGGVIRDVLGTGLGGKPICNTDVFCFAPPDFPPDDLPPGVLHPRRVMHGVVAGVRDYGNRMGIPTVNGSILFDERYLANPLVFCGTVGLIPIGMEAKRVNPGDLVVAVGGRTGRDGIHGATFSSEGLTEASETISGGAVQIGNAIAEKKVLDVILQARDRGLYTAITDCGAGGFSSAVGEMGADLGARVELENCPLKYEGLSYTEIWISESQERMVLSVPPEKWEQLRVLCAGEDVEAAILGTFEATGRLKLTYRGNAVADLSMHFLHDGRPDLARTATWTKPAIPPAAATQPLAPTDALKAILASYSVCSKEWVIRQYDHEVQGGSVVKPLVGVVEDGPSDAAVVAPVLGSPIGLAIGNGLNPHYADLDPRAAAACAIDEAVRNVVAVGGDPTRTAILDNFCWGNVRDPEMLGALVRTSEACRDVAIAYGTPFVSGKDSLNNEYVSGSRRISIPHTLLVTSLARVPDVTKCVTMDLKEPGNDLLLVGATRDELGGSHYERIAGAAGGAVPMPDLETAPKIFAAVHRAIAEGLVRACHDLSDGGLAVAVAEMAFAGGVGADVANLAAIGSIDDVAKLFSESPTRFVLEAKPADADRLRLIFAGLPFAKIGTTVAEPRLRIAGSNGEWLVWAKLAELKESWQKPLRW
jgi:phosphoribosylformylglycinamidine synthase subunit PurSL